LDLQVWEFQIQLRLLFKDKLTENLTFNQQILLSLEMQKRILIEIQLLKLETF